MSYVCRECGNREWEPAIDRFCASCGKSAETHALRLAPSEYWLVLARCEALPEDIAVCESEMDARLVIQEWSQGMARVQRRSGSGTVETEFYDPFNQEWMFDIWGPRELR